MKNESSGVEEFQFVYVEHKQRQNRGFPCQGKQFSPNDQIHGWNLRNHILGHESTVARKGHYNIFFLLKLSRDN